MKTFEISMGTHGIAKSDDMRPLPDRLNIIITQNKNSKQRNEFKASIKAVFGIGTNHVLLALNSLFTDPMFNRISKCYYRV